LISFVRTPKDFYDFQINLLHQFPVEAGKKTKERILPYMPGPLAEIDEEITGRLSICGTEEFRM
jgi:bud emergence protein 1